MSPARLIASRIKQVGKPIFRRRFTRPGAPPGEFQIAPDSVPPRIHAIRFNPETIEEFDPTSAEEAHALLRDNTITWIDVQGLADTELIKGLGERFTLHPLAVADTVNVGQRPKVEDYTDRLFVVLRMVTFKEDDDIQWEQVAIFIGEGFVLSFQENYDDCLGPVRDRLRQGKKTLRGSGSDYLGAMLIDAIIDGYFPVLEQFGERLERLENEVIVSPDPDVLASVYRAKRQLMTFRRATWPLRDALNQLVRESHELIDDAVIPYLRDAADHVMQVVDVNETYRELASSFVDVYLSSVANRTNEVMRVLTILATVFIPLTFLAGIYGMNFVTDDGEPAIPELRWKFGYPAFWIVSVTMAVAMFFVFRRLGWLGRRKRRSASNNGQRAGRGEPEGQG